MCNIFLSHETVLKMYFNVQNPALKICGIKLIEFMIIRQLKDTDITEYLNKN